MDFDSDEERMYYLQGEIDALENLKDIVKIINVEPGSLAVSTITQLISDKLKELNECMEAME